MAQLYFDHPELDYTTADLSMATPVGVGAGVLRNVGRACVGPSRSAAMRFLRARWDKGTFESIERTILYHWQWHGKKRGLSIIEYTQRAMRAWGDDAATFAKASDLQGREAWKVVSEWGTGLYTKAGRVIWFEPFR